MQRIISLIFLIIIFSCKKQDIIVIKESKDSVDYKSTNWQDDFGLTYSIDIDSVWGKPMRYYISNKNCDSIAKDFYLGNYRPKDEPKTEKLLNLATTKNDSLRPFYRWILNKTILIQDGALAEYTGIPARKYAEGFPKEFFEYMDSDKSGEKYKNWYNSIAYSGFYDDENDKNPKKRKANIVETMNSNCLDCNHNIKKRILRFAGDCVSYENKNQ